MRVSHNVRAVQVPVSNPMQLDLTTIYLVGHDQVLTIDSGSDEERYRWMLRGYLAAEEQAEIGQSAATHFHADHSANLRWLRDEFGADVYVLKEGAPRFENRLPDSGVVYFEEGDELSPGGDVRLRVLLTPGHTPDSVSFYIEDEGILFTGDTVLGGANSLTSDLGTYLESLHKIRELDNLQIICPGHGTLVYNPLEVIDDTLAHYEEFERKTLDIMLGGETLTSWDVTERLYQHLDRRRLSMAEVKVRSQLLKLRKDGVLKFYPGVPRPAEERAAAMAEQRRRRDIIRQAAEYGEQANQRAPGAQENPQSQEWLEPPLYELA